MANHQLKRVAMLILLQNDLQKGVEFYQKLGLKLKFQLKEKWAELELGGLKIGLCPTNREIRPIHSGIVMEVDDVQKMHNQLKEEITFMAEPQVKVHGVIASFQDPAGNIIDIYQPTPEKVAELVEKAKMEEGSCCKGGKCACKESGKKACAKAQSE